LNKRKLGSIYEKQAAEYLKEHGYVILEQNYRNRSGEIDLLAKKAGMLVVVEVKYRTSDSTGDPLEAVDVKKQRRICRCFLFYLTQKGLGTDVSCRFDVIAIYGDGRLRHVENAFDFQY
jgi:putative endonuclease